MKNKLIKYEKLKKELNLLNDSYFNENKSLIKDKIYDAKLKYFASLEQVLWSKNLITIENSPTQLLGGFASQKFQKVIHKSRMLSLNKAYNLKELKAFDNNISKVMKKRPNYFIDLKIDGLSIALRYQNGILTQAVTRGNGIEGENVTENIYQIQDIPKKVPYLNSFEVRGEIYFTKQNFAKLNNQNKNTKIFANPRNAASGTIRQLNKKVVAKRNLSSFVYHLENPTIHGINNFKEQQDFFKQNNLHYLKDSKEFSSIKLAFDFIQKFISSNQREKYNFDIDGIVIKLNNFSLYQKLGVTSKFPRSMIAFKFSDETQKTILKNIFTTIGRTGRVTYNATLAPVILNGTLVRSATLHNYDYINKLKLNIKDEVIVKKAGEIIPKVIKVSSKNNQSIFKKITKCISCNSNLFENQIEVDQYCNNVNCRAVKIKKIEHFASREAMNIMGLGTKIVEKFYDQNILNDYVDIFNLENHKAKILSLNFFGEKTYNNLINSINKSKSNSLELLIFAIGIKQIGKTSSKIIASKILKFENILTYDFNQLIYVRDFLDKTINSIKEFLSNKKNKILIKKLLKNNINFDFKTKKFKSQKLANYTFAITGTLSNPRKYYQEIISENSGSFVKSITNTITHLISNSFNSKKVQEAIKKGINIISENDFNELINK